MKILKGFALAASALLFTGTVQAAAVLSLPGYTNSFVATLPGPQGNFYGNIAVDSLGNRYVTGGLSNVVYKVDAGGNVSTFASPNTLSLGLGIIGNTVYMGAEGGWLGSKQVGGGGVTLLASSGSATMGLTASQDHLNLFVSTHGGLYKYNIASNSYSSTAVGSGVFSAVATGLDGKIFVADYDNGRILSYDSTLDAYTVFRSGMGNVAGLAVDPVTGELYAATESNGRINRISTNGATVTQFATMSMDGGYYPTALAFDPNGGSLYYLQNAGNQFSLNQISGFALAAAASVPEPASLAMFAIGLLALFALRRKQS